MKREDKELLKILAILGALVLAGGAGLSIFAAHRGSKSPVGDFVLGSAMTAVVITAALRSHE